ncbi:MAG TPA: hypothetical protein VGM88_29005 [Kofleriaceae bacterium]|jgi:hypothetical protein
MHRFVWAVALAACSGKASAPPDYFGKTPAPPGPLAKLVPGQPMTAAQTAVGGTLSPRMDDRSRSVPDCVLSDIPSGGADVLLWATCAPGVTPTVVGEVSVRVKHGSALASPDVGKTLAGAWGPPTDGTHPFAAWTGGQWFAEALIGKQEDVVTFVPLATAETFGGARKASLPAGLAVLKPGMNTSDVERMTPAKHGFGLLPAEHLSYGILNADGPEGLTGVDVTLHPRDAAVIRTAWGAPDGTTSGKRPSEFWLDAASGWRADLVTTTGATPSVELKYRAYAPLASLFALAPDGTQLAVAAPLIGQPLASMDKVREGHMMLKATEFSTLGYLETEPGPHDTIGSVTLVLTYSDAAAGAAMKAAFDGKLGANMTATDDGHAWRISVR